MGLPSEHHAVYNALIADTTRLDQVESDADAHMEASLRILADADELLAVWDGQPARGYGGTADVVNAARARRCRSPLSGLRAQRETEV
jgi:hypothetical protein